VKAVNQGLLATIAAPDDALKLMKARDPMMKVEIEKVRLGLALGLIDTPFTRANGLSTVVPERMQVTADNVAKMFNLEKAPAPADVFTSAYLPPASERMPAK